MRSTRSSRSKHHAKGDLGIPCIKLIGSLNGHVSHLQIRRLSDSFASINPRNKDPEWARSVIVFRVSILIWHYWITDGGTMVGIDSSVSYEDLCHSSSAELQSSGQWRCLDALFRFRLYLKIIPSTSHYLHIEGVSVTTEFGSSHSLEVWRCNTIVIDLYTTNDSARNIDRWRDKQIEARHVQGKDKATTAQFAMQDYQDPRALGNTEYYEPKMGCVGSYSVVVGSKLHQLLAKPEIAPGGILSSWSMLGV